MSTEVVHSGFGYFGKLPIAGDFIQQVLPHDFTNHFHEWLQSSLAFGGESLGQDFLTCYLNCPAWKFLINPGVCGMQGVIGVTIPSVDKVGRYFNFTLATVLPPEADLISYAAANREGFAALEQLALDILESDYPKQEIEEKLQGISLQFEAIQPFRTNIEMEAGPINLSIDQPMAFADQACALLSHYLGEQLGDFSAWWYGQEGQTASRMMISQGMPSPEDYIRLLTLENPPEQESEEMDFIDKIIAGDV